MKLLNGVYVGLGGAAGALIRYLIEFTGEKIWPSPFPAATLLINWCGTFFLGWLTGSLFKHIPSGMQLALGTGLIGATTTFSTLSADTVQLIESGHFIVGSVNLMLSGAGGLLFAMTGYRLGSRFEAGRERRE